MVKKGLPGKYEIDWRSVDQLIPYARNSRTHSIGKYMIGMSVPPKMTEAVARAVANQWLLK